MLKNKIRILPTFIFVASLSLSIKITNVLDLYQQTESKHLKIYASQAMAEEKTNKETAELTNVLNNGDVGDNKQSTINNAFTNSEILILQELAERREALDIRAKEIDKRTILTKFISISRIIGRSLFIS